MPCGASVIDWPLRGASQTARGSWRAIRRDGALDSHGDPSLRGRRSAPRAAVLPARSPRLLERRSRSTQHRAADLRRRDGENPHRAGPRLRRGFARGLPGPPSVPRRVHGRGGGGDRSRTRRAGPSHAERSGALRDARAGPRERRLAEVPHAFAASAARVQRPLGECGRRAAHGLDPPDLRPPGLRSRAPECRAQLRRRAAPGGRSPHRAENPDRRSRGRSRAVGEVCRRLAREPRAAAPAVRYGRGGSAGQRDLRPLRLAGHGALSRRLLAEDGPE
jgi:hypothetical protein